MADTEIKASVAVEPVLRLAAIEKAYKEGDGLLPILKKADFTLYPGQVCGLVAPSGRASRRCSTSQASWSGRTRARW